MMQHCYWADVSEEVKIDCHLEPGASTALDAAGNHDAKIDCTR